MRPCKSCGTPLIFRQHQGRLAPFEKENGQYHGTFECGLKRQQQERIERAVQDALTQADLRVHADINQPEGWD